MGTGNLVIRRKLAKEFSPDCDINNKTLEVNNDKRSNDSGWDPWKMYSAPVKKKKKSDTMR